MKDKQQAGMVFAMSAFALITASLNLMSNDDIPVFGGLSESRPQVYGEPAEISIPYLPSLPPPSAIISDEIDDAIISDEIDDAIISDEIDDDSGDEAGDQSRASERAAEAVETYELLRDTKLTSLCVIGSVSGAFLAVALFPIPSTRKMAAKFGSSMIAGSVFTPAIIRWLDWPLDADYVLAVSTAVAMVSVTALHVIVPTVEKIIQGKVDKAAESLGHKSDPPQESQ